MANATILPSLTDLIVTQLSRADFDLPSLQNSLNATDVTSTVKFNGILKDGAGAVITGKILIGVESDDGFVETIWLPASSSTDGQTFTGAVRGIDRNGLDYTVGDPANVIAHRGGARVFCSVSALIENLERSAIQGTIATGGTTLRLGDGASGYKTYGIYLDTGFKGIVRGNGTTTEWSNDGTTWVSIADSLASTVFKVSSNDTTPGYAEDKIVDDNSTITITTLNDGGNETLQIATAYTASPAEINVLDGFTGTTAQLNRITGGPGSNADQDHTHADLGEMTYTAYEAISAGNAVALLPIETKWYDQMTDTNVALGDSNIRRRYAVKYIVTQTTTFTDWNFRAREAVNGATALGDLVITFETDNAGEPSGTPLANATATISQVTQRTWTATMGTRTATFAGAVSLTAGQTIWEVRECSATDATNYLIFGANDSYDENYLTFTRLTYNLDTATWGSSTTTSILFGWSNTTVEPFGHAICPTDANWGGRTWSFIGFAESAINAQASGTISTDYATLTGLKPRRDYYLSTTPGEISTDPVGGLYIDTTVPTTFCYKIGRALSSTQIRVNPGVKKVIIFQETILTANTTRNYIIWFKPDTLRIYGQYNNPTIGYVTGGGTTDGNIRQSTTTGNSASSTSYSLFIGSNADYMTGVDSAYTDIGFTYTLTATGSGANVLYFIEATA